MMVTLEELRTYLERQAKDGNVVWYTELYDHFRIPKTVQRTDDNPIPLLLARLVQSDKKAGRPLLASLVVTKEKDRAKSELIPKDSYFDALCKIKMIPVPATKAEKRLLHASEKHAVMKLNGFEFPATK